MKTILQMDLENHLIEILHYILNRLHRIQKNILFTTAKDSVDMKIIVSSNLL